MNYNATTTTSANNGIRLGEILVEQGLLTRDEVRQILEAQQRQGRPFGVLAERLFGLDPRAVEGAWVRQYATLAAVDVGFEPIDADEDCLRLVNRRQAWQFQFAPVGREGGELVLVTDEAHLAKALRFAAATFAEPTFFRVVSTDQLQDLLQEFYPVPSFIAEFATTR